MCVQPQTNVIHTIVDSCGWVAVVDSGMNIDTELMRCVGSERLAVLPKVIAELEKLEEKNSSNLLLGILYQRNTELESDDSHTDVQILELAKNTKWPTLTIDKSLKRKLMEHNLPVIEVVGSKRLNLID